MDKITEYRFRWDEVSNYVKGFTLDGCDDMSTRDVSNVIHNALVMLHDKHDGIVQVCERLEGMKREASDAKDISDAMWVKIKIDAMEASPPLSRILPPVPYGVDCQGLLFVGNGKHCNYVKKGLACLQNVYHGRTPSEVGQRCGSGPDGIYAIDLSCPIEEVNEALSRFGLDTLDRVYYPMSSLPKSGLVGVLYQSGARSLLDCDHVSKPSPSSPHIGWRPADGIKEAE